MHRETLRVHTPRGEPMHEHHDKEPYANQGDRPQNKKPANTLSSDF